MLHFLQTLNQGVRMKKNITDEEREALIGGITEVQILGERACGGITGDITIHGDKVVITFAKYVERQSDGKWVREDNHSMSFSNNCHWVNGNLVINDGNNTIVVVHQSLAFLAKKGS